MSNATSTVVNGKTQTPASTSTPAVVTPPVVASKPAESTPETVATFDATILDRVDYRWLAGLDKQATNETTPLVVGNRYGMGSTRQTSLVGAINGREIKAIENYKPNTDPEKGPVEAYLTGESFINGKGESQIVLASDPVGKYLNPLGADKKSLVEQIQKWYDDPQDSYTQDQNGSTVVRDMVRDGILARTLSLIVQSVFGTGRADTLRGIKFVKLLSESDEAKQSLIWDIVKFAQFDGMSLTKFDRARVYAGAKSRYQDISDLCGISTKSESATKTTKAPVEASASDFAALLSTVPTVPKSNGASQSNGKKSKQDSPAPSGVEFDPSAALKTAKAIAESAPVNTTGETASKTVHAGESGAPALVKSESEKIANENTVTPPAEVKPEESKSADADKPAESESKPEVKNVDPVVEPPKEDKPAEEKKTDDK
jgi:hypothetical protein